MSEGIGSAPEVKDSRWTIRRFTDWMRRKASRRPIGAVPNQENSIDVFPSVGYTGKGLPSEPPEPQGGQRVDEKV